MKNKINRGLLPIYASDIKRLIGYCDTWGYGNKDTCKYVTESLIEILKHNFKINIDIDIAFKNGLYSELISLIHNINSGSKFTQSNNIKFDSYNIRFS